MSKRGLVATILDVYKKVTKFDKGLGVIVNGEDNLYPEKVDRFLNNSVTAKTCWRIMTTYISGQGYGDNNNKIIVNSNLGLTLQKFNNQFAKSLSKQRGAFIHVNYNLDFEPSSYAVMPYADCRLGKKDDNKYNGKILVSDKWGDKEFKKEDVSVFDVFNTDKKVIEAQINACDGNTIVEKIENYKGQIRYVNFDEEYYYALSQIDPVISDCDSEAQSSTYKNRALRRGFFGKTVVVTKPLAGTLEELGNDPVAFHQAETERENFKKTIDSFVGAENNSGVLHVEIEHDSDGLDEVIKFENIESNIDDKVFEFTEKSVFENILMSFNSIPSGLVRPVNTLFGQSSEAIKQMQRVYQDNTRVERDQLEQEIQYLMSIFTNPVTGLNLIPLIEEKTQTEEDGTVDN